MNHAERYEYLVNKMAAIRWRGSDLDASYHAALFLMASHPALFQKMDRYLCPEGIDFTKMMRKEEFEYGSMVAGSIVLKAKSLHLPKDAFSADFLINDLERSNLY